MKGLLGTGFPQPENSEDRAWIMRLWDSREFDTVEMARVMRRDQYYIERQLHVALDLRRAMKSLDKRGA